MKRLLVIAVLLLTACSPQARLNELVDTASGTIHDVRETVDSTAKTVQDSVDDVQDRWGKLQSGATLIKNGLNTLGEVVD
jgi:hypothetical protein